MEPNSFPKVKKSQQKKVSPDAASRDEIREALLRSGYLLEMRAADLFIKSGYEVRSNQTFEDPITKKSRELDFIAYPLKSSHDRKYKASVTMEFVVETINNPTPIAFFPTNENDFDALSDLKFTSNPIRGDYGNHFTERLNLEHECHAANFVCCSQFCGFKRKKDTSKELMALHPDDMYETLCKLFYSVKEEEKHQYPDQSFDPKNFRFNLNLIQPLLVLQGEALLVSTKGKGFTLKRAGYINYKFNFSHNGENHRLFIDVVTEKSLEKYLIAMKMEQQAIFKRLRNLHREWTKLVENDENRGAIEAPRTAV